jgi:membrane protease YdiL (CAAX protease family)
VTKRRGASPGAAAGPGAAPGPGVPAWLGATGLGAAALLRSSFAAKAGSARFYLLTAGLAGTWTGGALGAGPVPWRGDGWRDRPGGATEALIVVPVATGAATFAVFYGAARVARRHRALRRAIASVLHYAEAGSTPLVMLIAAGSGVAEELFFRGALWSGPHPLRTTTVAYAASTAATGNPVLVLAGLVTSVIFGWQRRATGGVLAPAVTHVTWSVLMLRFLPPLFRDADPAAGKAGASGTPGKRQRRAERYVPPEGDGISTRG